MNRPLLAGSHHLVAGALGDDLPLELREGEQDVQGQLAHGAGGVQLLGHRHEAHAVAIEDLHHPSEVHAASG